MTTIEDAARTYALEIPGIADQTGERMYPNFLPQADKGQITAVLPALVYSTVSTTTNYNQNVGDTGTDLIRLQIEGWADTKQSASLLEAEVRRAFSGFIGQWGGTCILSCFRENAFIEYRPDVQKWRLVTDYMVRYQLRDFVTLPPKISEVVAVVSPTLLFFDSFNDADGTNLTAHTPEVDTVGGGWTVISGTWTIQSDKLAHNNFFLTTRNVIADAGEGDAVVSGLLIVDVGFSQPVIIARYTDESNHWLVRLENSGDVVSIREINGGSNILRSFALFTLADNTEYLVDVTLSDESISVDIDGDFVVSYAFASFNKTQTIYGIQNKQLEQTNQFSVTTL